MKIELIKWTNIKNEVFCYVEVDSKHYSGSTVFLGMKGKENSKDIDKANEMYEKIKLFITNPETERKVVKSEEI